MESKLGKSKNGSIIKVTNRDLAKMFTYHLPIEDTEKLEANNAYYAMISNMPDNQKLALKMAYIWSSKVPKEEREDFFQELVLHLLKIRTNQEKLAYTVARCDWLDFWRDYKRKAQHYGGSLNSFDMNQFEDTDISELPARDKRQIREYIIGACEYENIEDRIDTERKLNKLPAKIKTIVIKRMAGDKLQNKEYKALNYYIETHKKQILTIMAN
ncbi:MAG: hypothetical protein PHG61_02050 [Candidatus Marinimicrobia bacterium]|nr:hypothetical protein [Candidatus Neomarinimicrobiota bacterium]